MTDLLVRAARVADLDTLLAFNLAMALETEHRSLDAGRVRAGVEALLSDPGKGRYLVAERDGQIAGQLMLTREWSDWRNGDFWWIQSVYVAPAYRRGGVFRALFERVRSEATTREDVCGIRLYVEKDNDGARRTYAGLGASSTDYRLMEWDFTHQ